MPNINLTNQDFQSLSENVARVKLSNMYMVENPLSVSGISWIPRPTLESFVDLGSTVSIRGIWFQSQAGTTTIYVVADDKLYKMDKAGTTTKVGTINGTGFCTFASTIYGIGICSGGLLYIYDGTTLTAVTVPGSQLATDITSLDNYFIVGIQDTSKFYWIAPGETTINGLSFASAERNPDDVVSVQTIGDELWVIGQSTCEVFQDTGDANAPFQRISGRVFETGCISKHSVTSTLKNTIPCLIWVTPSKEVVLSQGFPNKISNESVEEILKSATKFIGWSFRTNRHDFYVLNTDVATLVYDVGIDKWYRWSTYQKDFWNAVSGVQVNDTVYAVTDFDGNIYKLAYNQTDTNNDYLVCEVTGFIPNSELKPIPCNFVTLFLNYGFADSYDVSPVVELRWSDDRGYTWSPYMQGETGLKGKYDTVVSFRSLGQITRPGRYIEIRFSEVQSLRLDGATFND